MNFEELVGMTLTKIEGDDGLRALCGLPRAGDKEIRFTTSDGRVFRQYHYQECCEHVEVCEIHGDFDDLIGTPILLAEKAVYENEPGPDGEVPDSESYSWTFYKLATVKGHVTIRWLGESNGFYSEAVDFEEVL